MAVPERKTSPSRRGMRQLAADSAAATDLYEVRIRANCAGRTMSISRPACIADTKFSSPGKNEAIRLGRRVPHLCCRVCSATRRFALVLKALFDLCTSHSPDEPRLSIAGPLAGHRLRRHRGDLASAGEPCGDHALRDGGNAADAADTAVAVLGVSSRT